MQLDTRIRVAEVQTVIVEVPNDGITDTAYQIYYRETNSDPWRLWKCVNYFEMAEDIIKRDFTIGGVR